MRHRDEQVGTVLTHLPLHIPFLPSGMRIAKAHPEMVMGTETGKQFQFMDGVTNPASDSRCIVKDQKRWNVSNKLKDILKPLADILGSFTAKYQAVSVVAVGKGYRKIFFPAKFPCLIEVRFPKIHLCRSGIPDQFKVRFLVCTVRHFFMYC